MKTLHEKCIFATKIFFILYYQPHVRMSMQEKTHYKNGQIIRELNENRMTYYYKSGAKKAEGDFFNGKMQGEWSFYNENGVLLQIGHLKDDIKDGSWVRLNQHGEIEYNEVFQMGKKVKK